MSRITAAKKYGFKSRKGDKKEPIELDYAYMISDVSKGSSRTSSTERTRKSNTGNTNGELDSVARGVSPFDDSDSSITVSDTIHLTQLAYFNVPIFRSTIDIQSEFCNSPLHFKSSTKSVEKFFKAWDEMVGGFSHRAQFFREWFRSGNVFNYIFTGELPYKELRKITRAKEAKVIPIRYHILNPKFMRCNGGASFANTTYSKVLNPYEIKRLSNPKTAEEKAFVAGLTKEQRGMLMSGTSFSVDVEPSEMRYVACGKMDYEPFAVPMYYPVLEDINFKLTLRKAEAVIARTCDFITLWINVGEPERDLTENSNVMRGITELFSSDSVGRVFVADWTTKANFVIPDLNKIFGPEKYETVNMDIANGLMNIFWGEDKFANSMVKINVFLERLNQAREAYLNEFLYPEMKKIAEILGFNTIPEVTFEDVNLKDEVEYLKIYTRLAELGMITPKELFETFKTKQLPIIEDSIDNQKEFKKQKDSGLYESTLNKPKEPEGRPGGTKKKQSTKKVKPIGASIKYSLEKVQENINKANLVTNLVEATYKEQNKIQRLSKNQKNLCEKVVEALITNEPPDAWESKLAEYLVNPLAFGPDFEENLSLAEEFNISPFSAALLKNCEKIVEEEEISV